MRKSETARSGAGTPKRAETEKYTHQGTFPTCYFSASSENRQYRIAAKCLADASTAGGEQLKGAIL